MPVSPASKRLAEARVDERLAELKDAYRSKIERVLNAVEPPLSNRELSAAFELDEIDGEGRGTTVGRWVSGSHRLRRSVPDRHHRALLDELAAGRSLIAVRGQEGAREVLVCQPHEAARLGSQWTVVSATGRRWTFGFLTELTPTTTSISAEAQSSPRHRPARRLRQRHPRQHHSMERP